MAVQVKTRVDINKQLSHLCEPSAKTAQAIDVPGTDFLVRVEWGHKRLK